MTTLTDGCNEGIATVPLQDRKLSLIEFRPYINGGQRATAVVNNGGETTHFVIDYAYATILRLNRHCGLMDKAAVAAICQMLADEDEKQAKFEYVP